MANPPRYPGAADDTGGGPDHAAAPAARNRTKVLLVIIGIALLVVMVGLHLAGVTPH